MFLKLKICATVREKVFFYWLAPNRVESFCTLSDEEDNILLLDTLITNTELNTLQFRNKNHRAIITNDFDETTEQKNFGDYYFECKSEYGAKELAKAVVHLSVDTPEKIFAFLKKAETKILSKEQRLLCAMGLTKLSLFKGSVFPKHVIRSISEHICDNERKKHAGDNEKLSFIESKENKFFASVEKHYQKKQSQINFVDLAKALTTGFKLGN